MRSVKLAMPPNVATPWGARWTWSAQLEAMPSPIGALATGAYQRALGQTGSGSLFELARTVQPVAILQDVSEALAGQPIEARGLLAHTETFHIAAGNAGRFAFQVLAAGGAILERLELDGKQAGVTTWTVDIVTGTPEATPLPHLSVGGTPTLCSWSRGDGATTTGTPIDVADPLELNPVKLWVPQGSLLLVVTNALGGGTGGNFTFTLRAAWREIAQGNP